MDHEQAFYLLGLYIGASEAQIEAKHAQKSQEFRSQIADADPQLSGELETGLLQLETARRVALGRAPDDSHPTLPQTAVAYPSGPQSAPLPATGQPPTGYQTVPATATAIPLQPTGAGRSGSGLKIAIVLVAGLLATMGAWYLATQKNAETHEGTVQEEARALDASWTLYADVTGTDLPQQFLDARKAFSYAEEVRAEKGPAEAEEWYLHARDHYQEAFQDEAKRLHTRWDDEVLAVWDSELADRFPFDPLAPEDASAQSVAELFNPVDGSIWALSRRMKALAGIRVGDKPVMSFDHDFDTHGTQAQTIRDALFPAGGRTFEVPLRIEIEKPRGVESVSLELDGQRFYSKDHWGPQVKMIWRQNSEGATLTFNLKVGRWPIPIHKGMPGPFGLLRLLSGASLTEEEGEYVYTWDSAAKVESRLKSPGKDRKEKDHGDRQPRRPPPIRGKFEVRIVFPEGHLNALDVRLYSRFEMPR